MDCTAVSSSLDLIALALVTLMARLFLVLLMQNNATESVAATLSRKMKHCRSDGYDKCGQLENTWESLPRLYTIVEPLISLESYETHERYTKLQR